jgi:hypothetical protein
MKRLTGSAFAVLWMYVLLLGALALDLAWRIWISRSGFETAMDAGLLLLLEAVRGVVTLTLAGLALHTRRRREAGHAALAAALLFFAAAYANMTAFAAFPGFLQERLALLLVSAGTPRPLLLLLFGSVTWLIAPAVACLTCFAIRYPGPPEPAAIRAVHSTGRRGMMREVALAGTDVRSLVHRAAARAVEKRMVSPRSLTVIGIAGAAACALAPGLFTVPVLLLAALLFSMAIAYLRTSQLTREGPHRDRLRRLAAAGLSVSTGIVASSALGFIPGGATAQIALAMAAAAPLSAAFFLMRFALLATEPAMVAGAG